MMLTRCALEAADRFLICRGMPDLYAIQPKPNQLIQQIKAVVKGRVGQHGNAAGLVNRLQHPAHIRERGLHADAIRAVGGK